MAAGPATGTVPQQLLGRYNRTISAAALAKTTYPQAAGRWSLTFSKDGTALVQGPGAVSAYVKVTAGGAGQLRVTDEFCTPHAGTYRWTLAGRLLTLTSATDRCADRATILAGVWKR